MAVPSPQIDTYAKARPHRLFAPMQSLYAVNATKMPVVAYLVQHGSCVERRSCFISTSPLHSAHFSESWWVVSKTLFPIARKMPSVITPPSGLQARVSKYAPFLPWLCVAVGIVLRCVQYFHDRSLFLDEAFVATNIANKSYAELLSTLQYDQRAPAGFLWCVKLAYDAFGPSDLALRLVPLLSGVLSVFVFFAVAKRYLSGWAVSFAVLLFSLSAPQIFYSSELKQYITEVAAGLVLLWLFASLDTETLGPWKIARMGILGILCIWFAFTSVIMMMGLGLCFGILKLMRRQWSELGRFVIVGCLWLAGFFALYAVQLRNYDSDPDWLKSCWTGEFIPLPPQSIKDLRFFVAKAFHFTTSLVGLDMPGIGVIAAFFGIISLFRKNWYRLGLLLLPIAVLFLISGLKIYPCGGRVTLFVAPLMILIMSAGICEICSWEDPRSRLLGGLMAVLILSVPSFIAVHHLAKNVTYLNTMFGGYLHEETKPVMAYIREHWREGDVVYLYNQSNVAFEYYAPQYGFKEKDFIRGILAGFVCPPWQEVQKDLEKLRGKPRVWVFFSHVWTIGGVDEKRLYLYFLDQMGRRLDEFGPTENSNASAVLYDMSKKTTTSIMKGKDNQL